MDSPRGRPRLADLPTVRIFPADPPRPLPLADRDPCKLGRSKARVLEALAGFGREMTAGEITGFVLTMLPAADRDEVLAELVASGRVLAREITHPTRPGLTSRAYRLAPDAEGGA